MIAASSLSETCKAAAAAMTEDAFQDDDDSILSATKNSNSLRTCTTNTVKNRPRNRPLRSSVALSHNTCTLTLNRNRTTDDDGTSNYEIEKAVAADVAICISNQLKTLGLIAALLSSWAVTVYGGERPFDDGLCFGPAMVQASYVVFWVSLGFFFLCVSSSLAIIADLDGVPQKYLFQHFKQKIVRLTYQIPEISMIFGIIFLAMGYAIDVGERSGCIFFYFGCIAAFGFVGMVAALFWVLRRARQRLHGETGILSSSSSSLNNESGSCNLPLGIGRHFIATWRDRLDYLLLSEEDIDTMNIRRRSIGVAIE